MSEYINAFPGYEYKYLPEDNSYHNLYRGVDLGKGGWVYSKPGIYTNVALLDVASLHPHSIIALNKLGKYTQRYGDLLHARVLIKHKQFDEARKLFDGKLAKYLESTSEAKALSKALKLPLNAFFGISFASFPNPARDSRDKNNIIALRGALFMKTLFDEVEAKGFKICHVKTDSIKIPNATKEIVEFVQDFARKYGYEMEHEATYDRMCLIDKAQYIAAYMNPDKCRDIYGYVPGDNEDHFSETDQPWTATGDEFQRPYIFKTLFSGEQVTFDDMCITNTVREGAIYLDFKEGLKDVEAFEKEMKRRKNNELHPDKPMKLSPAMNDISNEELEQIIAEGHNYRFVGRVGRFYPIRKGRGGADLLVYRKEKYDSVAGAKGFLWMEAEMVQKLGKEADRDAEYYEKQIDEAVKEIKKLGSFDRFIDMSRDYEPDIPDDVPWIAVPCGDGKYNTCLECPNLKNDICARGYSLSSFIEKGSDAK